MAAVRIEHLPAGRYAVGASGGADSTALVRLLAERNDCELTLVHLDHELRQSESAADARFVADLAASLGLDCVIERRSVIESALSEHPANPSARYRAARLALISHVVRDRRLEGVLLAHHADDQAEGLLLRLLRGASTPFLGGMTPMRVIDGLRVFRPLLGCRRDDLRAYLRQIGQPWREDASNASPHYRRNVVRQWLASHPEGVEPLLRLAAASARLRESLEAAAPVLPERFACGALPEPQIVAEYALRRWLIDRGAPPDDVSPATCQRLLRQATDVSQPPRQHYPGAILVRRRQKWIDVMPGLPLQSARSHGKDETTPAAEL